MLLLLACLMLKVRPYSEREAWGFDQWLWKLRSSIKAHQTTTHTQGREWG